MYSYNKSHESEEAEIAGEIQLELVTWLGKPFPPYVEIPFSTMASVPSDSISHKPWQN